MKTDDIFEALTDIDDKLIEKAYPLMDDPQAPVYVLPAERTKPRRKTIAAVAACAAGAVCVAALGTIGVNYLREKGIITSSPAASGAERYYPENANYTVSEKITGDTANLSWAYTTNGAHFERWDDESTYAANYDELAAKSDLIVAGQFVDLPHQTQDPDKTHVSSHAGVMVNERGEKIDLTEEGSYDDDAFMMNYLQVERVIKGSANPEYVPFYQDVIEASVKAGDEIPIHQETSINLGGSGTHIVFAYDRLTPMLKGDEWIYFLKKTDDGYYVPVNGAQGRYPMPNNKNVDLTAGGVDGIDEFGTYNNAAPARQEIYDRLKKLLSGSDQNIQSISLPEDGSKTEFFMDEFPDYTFRVTKNEISFQNTNPLVDSIELPLISAWEINDLYLADLNADGKREICATIRIGNSGVTAIRVCDLANGGDYVLKSDNAEDVYTLAEEGGRLMAVTREYLPLYYSRNPEERSRELLTLNMMSAMKPDREEVMLDSLTENEEMDFYVGEFPSMWFTVSKSDITVRRKDHNGTLSSIQDPDTLISADEIQKLFLYDMNGDGLREICAQVDVGDKIGVRVFDIAENASYSLFGDEVNGFGLSADQDNYNNSTLKIDECRKDVSTGKIKPVTSSYQFSVDCLIKDTARPRIYDISKVPKGATVTLEEYPEFALRLNSYTVYLLEKDTQRLRQVIIGNSNQSNLIINLFLTDLNGDGGPEVCAVLEDYTGGLNRKIEIYDILHDEKYFSYTLDYDEGTMKLENKDDVLYAVITNAGQELYREPLSLELDIIKPLSDFIEDH